MAAELKQNIETVNHLKKKLDKGVSFEKVCVANKSFSF